MAGMRDTSLVVICGVPRSGTSFVGRLLNRSPDLAVFVETPGLSTFPSLMELVGQYRGWCARIASDPVQSWRAITPDLVEERVREILLAFCRAVRPAVDPGDSSRWDAPEKSPSSTICLKAPGAESDAPLYDSLFPTRKPKYVYCMREPGAVYGSLLSMAWGAGMRPEDFLAQLRRSVDRAEALLSERPPRAFVFAIDRVGPALAAREGFVERLFQFIDVPVVPEALRFAADWPHTNRARDVYGDQEFLPREEREARIETVARLLADDPELQARIARLLEAGAA